MSVIEGSAVMAQLDIDTTDHLMRQAVSQGWTVHRRTSTYFVANRRIGQALADGRAPGTEQVSVSVRDGKLEASRVEVVATTNVTDQVLAWLEGRR